MALLPGMIVGRSREAERGKRDEGRKIAFARGCRPTSIKRRNWMMSVCVAPTLGKAPLMI
jgi:hypothetical protein